MKKNSSNYLAVFILVALFAIAVIAKTNENTKSFLTNEKKDSIGQEDLTGEATIQLAGHNGVAKVRINENYECPVEFYIEEMLTNPTKNSVVLSMVPKEQSNIFVEYTTDSWKTSKYTALKKAYKDTKVEFMLTGLLADSSYSYRVWCKTEDEFVFGHRNIYISKTLPEANGKFSFAFTTDSHAFGEYTEFCQGLGDEGIRKIQQTVQNIKNDGSILFWIDGGDDAMPNCADCGSCTLEDGEQTSDNSADSQRDAELR